MKVIDMDSNISVRTNSISCFWWVWGHRTIKACIL